MVLATAGGCRAADEAPGRVAPAAPPAPARGDRVAPPPGPRAPADAGQGDGGVQDLSAALGERLATSAVVGARPISPRSLSIKVTLESGDRAVFKPLRKTNRSARYEVAYSKIAPLVGADLVPTASLRRVPLAQVAGLLAASYPDAAAALREQALVDDRGFVGGAAIAWIGELGPPAFEGDSGWRRLAALLAADGPEPRDAPGVVAAARVVVADYVAGSWDRFSGGNLFAEAGGPGLWLIDNNGSFAAWSDRQRDRMDAQLAACARFSSSQIARLRALTASQVRAAIAAEERRGVVDRVLTDDEVALLLARRDAVLRRVDTEVAARGEAAVLSLP
jgi:hypothetical protein